MTRRRSIFTTRHLRKDTFGFSINKSPSPSGTSRFVRSLEVCHLYSLSAWHSGVADQGRDARADHFDGLHERRVRQRGRVHLKGDPGDAAQRLAVSENLLGHFVRAANQQRAVWTSLGIEGRTRQRRPAALLANISDRLGEAREKDVGSFLRGLCDIARCMDADRQSVGRVPVLPAGFSIEIDERSESPWL